ncbi:MAG: M20/M25/M40 family metallo-hydrolase, partial [Gemmatimonadota bacterium]
MGPSPTPTSAARLLAPGRRVLAALAPPAAVVPPAAAALLVAATLLAPAASLPSIGRLAAQEALTGRALEAVAAYRDDHAAALVREYADLLSIPNVASDREGIRRNADEIVRRLEAAGVEAELLERPGASPVVYGALDVPGATRTLGLYVHYDGQPADPSNWTHAPWEPVVYTGSMEDGAEARGMPQDGEPVDPEWRIYARSAGDDKAPIGALIPTLRALRDAGITPTSNLRFLFEGEEEAGSTHLEAYLREWRERWDEVDLWLFFDGPVHQSGRPQLTFGVRGVTGMGLTVYGPTRPLHSGHYGNWAPVPGQMLADLLASMKDGDTGEVLVDGFYETVAPVGRAEREALAELPSYDDELRRELGLARTEGEGETLAERILLPSLTVRGL